MLAKPETTLIKLHLASYLWSTEPLSRPMGSLSIQSLTKLNDGTTIPLFGLGVWASTTCTKACLTSFDEGYRHIDTAQLYRNEAEVGVQLRT